MIKKEYGIRTLGDIELSLPQIHGMEVPSQSHCRKALFKKEPIADIANPLWRMKLQFSRIAEMDVYKRAQRAKAMEGLSKSREI